MAEEIVFKVFRFDPNKDSASRYQDYKVPVRDSTTVLDALFHILDKMDHSLSFRYCCRAAVCGSCAMFVNGCNRLACNTNVKALKAPVVTVAPLPHAPVVKDLAVDIKPFFEKMESIKPFLINDTGPPEKERPQSIKDRERIDEMIQCIMCGACYSSCTMNWWDDEYLGPAALMKAYRFNADSRDRGEIERLKLVNSEHGVWRCHTIFNCAEDCPKGLVPTYSIQQLKKRVIVNKLKGKL